MGNQLNVQSIRGSVGAGGGTTQPPNRRSSSISKMMDANLHKTITAVTFDKLLEDVKETVNIMDQALGKSHFQMEVFPKKFSDFPWPSLWKFQVEIIIKRGLSGRTIMLNLKQFYRLFSEIQKWPTIKESQSKRGEEEVDSQLDNFLDSFNDKSTCAICMEKKTAIALECTHAFCKECLEGWRSRSDQCPLCRKPMNSKGDDWVLMEDDMKTEDLEKYLVDRLQNFQT